MLYIVFYVLCILVWGAAQVGLQNAGLLIIPPGQSRLYLLGGAAVLMGAWMLLGNLAVDQSEAGNRNGADVIAVLAVLALIALFVSAFIR